MKNPNATIPGINVRRAIHSRQVVTPEGVGPATVVFEDGVILGIETQLAGEDFRDCFILPGLVDTHVHINQPGRTEWEGFETATRAAAAGGVTCLVDMPLNSIPATTTVSALEQKRESAVGNCFVDYAFWGGSVRGNAGELKLLAAAGVRGFKCFMAPSGVDEFEMVSEADLRLAVPEISATGLPLLVHAELPSALLDISGTVCHHYADYLASRPDEAEVQAIRLLIDLCREFKTHIHVVHLASAKPLAMLSAARAEGLPITVETCPHYLYFSAESIPDGATQFKCAPPIRDKQTTQLLWNGLREGVIDLIATDHSPCPPALKSFEAGDFAKAWGGIASLSVALSAVVSAASTQGFGIGDIVRWMSRRPAELAGLQLRKGSLRPGCDADLVIFDPDTEWQVTKDNLHFRHPVTPYLGQTFKGRVTCTYLRGECIYSGGEVIGSPRGRECRV